eukprot:5015199-Amphidinium_carterae.2
MEQQGTPVVQLDYSFLTDGEAQVPLLAAVDNVYHRKMAIWVPLKGADEYASGSEHSALALSKVAVEPLAGLSARQTPVNSKGSNGRLERLQLELQEMFRTIRSCLEEQYRMRLPTHHPILPWLFRHTCWLRDRFLVDQRDQRTAYQRHYQRLYPRP